MIKLRSSQAVAISLLLMIVCAISTSSKFSDAHSATPQTTANSDEPQNPWSASETIDAPTLAKNLSNSKSAAQPIIVCVGFHTLFEGAHIRGASFHGPASTAQGLNHLKDWAKLLPRSANLILYCGCCPLAHCPNVRPAYTALRQMGFTHLRVLILPHDFAKDWVEPGYPFEKGK